MDPILTVDFSDEKLGVFQSTGKSVTEGEQEVQLGTMNDGSSFCIYVARDKRKRNDSLSDDDFDFLEDEDDSEDEEYDKKGKRLMTEEEKLSSHRQWFDSQLEDNKNSLLEEMKEKENKLTLIRTENAKESSLTSTAVERLTEELALLRVMYEQLII